MIYFLLILFLLSAGVFLFVRQTKFGSLPTGSRKERILKSPYYQEGKFQNLSETPDLTEGATFISILWDFLFKQSKRSTPSAPLPTIKSDLKNLDTSDEVFVWFGHSSYLLQTNGKKFLVDPVFSGSASPLEFSTKSFKGTDVYSAEDMPEIDFLILTHDHWDHLDYQTLMALQPKIKRIICSLGVGEHLEYWGFPKSIITELEWFESCSLDTHTTLTATPARHFSGRAFKRNQALWSSFVLKGPSGTIFIGGDGGYDHHFKHIGKEFGPFDFAILECGQYNESWKHIHLMPEEVAKAATELSAQKIVTVHWGKFALALHDWDEPILRAADACRKANVPLATPKIGELFRWKENHTTTTWWKEIT